MSDEPREPWFSYDQNEGLLFHDTEQEARASAELFLDSYRDEAPDGWAEEVTQICWGRVYGDVREVERRPRNEDDVCVSSEIEEIVDYALVDDPDASGRVRGSERSTYELRIVNLQHELEQERLEHASTRRGYERSEADLQAEADELRSRLLAAATSLETISRQAGRGEFLKSIDDVRAYASNRARAARGEGGFK